jgi:hypothetical protein
LVIGFFGAVWAVAITGIANDAINTVANLKMFMQTSMDESLLLEQF